jgi:hypothetical protein
MKMRKLEISYNLCSVENNAILLDMSATVQGRLIFKVGCQVKGTKELLSGNIVITPKLSVDTYTYDDFSIDSTDTRFITAAHEFVIQQDYMCI